MFQNLRFIYLCKIKSYSNLIYVYVCEIHSCINNITSYTSLKYFMMFLKPLRMTQLQLKCFLS